MSQPTVETLHETSETSSEPAAASWEVIRNCRVCVREGQSIKAHQVRLL